MRYKSIIYIIILLLSNFYSNSQTLSKESKISLLTCSTGNQLHELFGHSAIRVKDEKNRIDWVFNYGTFNFDTPNFYYKFCKGSLMYMMAATNYPNFEYAYKHYKRSIYEQDLILDSVSKQQIFNALKENYKPENKYYKYEFIYDNCATRIRDIIEKNTSSKVSFNYPDKDKSFRNILNEYLENSKWIKWGINTILGRPLDKKAEAYEYMFIPDYLMYSFDSATINNKHLVKEKKTIYKAPLSENPTAWYFSPIFIFSFLSVILIAFSFFCMRRNIVNHILDYILFSLLGIVGIAISFMWFISDYVVTTINFNILYAFPLHLLALFFIRKRNTIFIKRYFKLNIIAILHAIGLFYILPIGLQTLPLASLPIMILVVLRSYMIIKDK